jgi:hypothetical protein
MLELTNKPVTQINDSSAIILPENSSIISIKGEDLKRDEEPPIHFLVKLPKRQRCRNCSDQHKRKDTFLPVNIVICLYALKTVLKTGNVTQYESFWKKIQLN